MAAQVSIHEAVSQDLDQQRELFLWKYGSEGITREELQKEQKVREDWTLLLLVFGTADHRHYCPRISQRLRANSILYNPHFPELVSFENYSFLSLSYCFEINRNS